MNPSRDLCNRAMPLPKQAELDEFEAPLDTPPKSSVICFHKAPAAVTVPKLGESSY